jgi:indole-3-glycerol phosphate synthase
MVDLMNESTYLDRILVHKREEVARQKLKVPLAEIQRRVQAAPPPRPFGAALRHSARAALIAEIKKQSPSKGLLMPQFDPLKLAQTYIDNGADAISVLTDVRFFGGSLQYLKSIRELQARVEHEPQRKAHGQLPVPLLRKDFILEPYQVYEARAYGADALLLIVAALDDARLRELLDLTEALGMEALVEVHDEAELERSLAAGASVVGVNNRDLHTFEVDLHTTERLAARLDGCNRPILVSESGIHTAADTERLRGHGVDAILVGESIVTAPDIAAKVQELSRKPKEQTSL